MVEYVPSPVTIWDKELVLIDELNRAVPELQSKWLEIIRSRKIMGFPTHVKWVWAAMNPMSYSATNALDAALVGRFAFFLYPPDVLQMEEADRIRVAMHINGDDAPSLGEWIGQGNKSGDRPVSARASLRLGQSRFFPVSTVSQEDVASTGAKMRETLERAGGHFLRLRDAMPALAEFLAKFSDLLMRESKGEVALDGRRLGFLHRNLLANRAGRAGQGRGFRRGAAGLRGVGALRGAVEHPRGPERGIAPARGGGAQDGNLLRPARVLFRGERGNRAGEPRLRAVHARRNCCAAREILLTQPLGAFVLSKAWTDLMAEERDITLLAYTALQVEARRPRHDSAGIARLAVRQDFLAQPEHELHRLPHGRFHRVHRRGRGAVAAVHGTRQSGGVSPGIAARGRRAGHPGAHP